MGLELVIFIVAILFGIFIYWRESKSNNVYRAINKIFNSKKLQMKADDVRGFVYKRTFLPRLLFVVTLFLILGLAIQFFTPFQIFTSYYGVSAFASIIVGTLLGTYLANFILKSGKVIEEKSDSLGEIVSNTIEKGKDYIEDLNPEKPEKVEENVLEKPKTEEKSARERLKDKGLL